MKKIFVIFVLIFSLSACASTAPVETQAPALEQTIEPTPTVNFYSNSDFGISFEYPLDWFIQDYVSDNTLRVEIGSDVVYPYGERPDEGSSVFNSYTIVFQYTKNNGDSYVNDLYESLNGMQDGESTTTERSKLTRIRQFELGNFKGFEFVSTLSDTAQTPPIYSREVILLDNQFNLLTIFGTPNNVMVNEGENWRDVYQAIDQENLDIFHQIIESITLH